MTKKLQTIRYAPIKPEEDVMPFLSAATDYFHKLQDKHDELVAGRQTTRHDSTSMRRKLERLQKKNYTLISFLQSLQLGLVMDYYPVILPEEVPSTLKRKIQPLLDHIKTLNRRAYKKFFKKILEMVKTLQRQMIDFDNIINMSIDRLRPIRPPQIPIHFQTNQLPPPPSLQRSMATTGMSFHQSW